MLDNENTKVLSWLRQVPASPQVVVSVNFTADAQTVNLATDGAGIRAERLKTLLKSPGTADPKTLSSITLAPFGVYIGQVQ